MQRWGEELGATPILGLQVHGWTDWPGLAWPSDRPPPFWAPRHPGPRGGNVGGELAP